MKKSTVIGCTKYHIIMMMVEVEVSKDIIIVLTIFINNQDICQSITEVISLYQLSSSPPPAGWLLLTLNYISAFNLILIVKEMSVNQCYVVLVPALCYIRCPMSDIK